MHYFVTGGAGFIGSNLIRELLKEHTVTVFDNMSSGFIENLVDLCDNPRFKYIPGDTLIISQLAAAMRGCDFVIHLAANADVRYGLNYPRRDLEQNTIATHNVLEAMRINGISKIAFSSTGSVYGEAAVVPTPENAPFPVQTSLYGASKLACEGLISAYCEGYGMQAWIFRFVSILGEHYSHGHVHAFYQQLKDNPDELLVLGSGEQSKSFLHVQDCVAAILCAIDNSSENVNIFNLGTQEMISINDSVAVILDELKLAPKILHTEGDRGWVGDNPLILLDTQRIRSLGWEPKYTIRDAVRNTVRFLDNNPWLANRRDTHA